MISTTFPATTLKRVSDLEQRYIKEVLQEGLSNSRSGAFIQRLEERFASIYGVKYAIALNNGTATLHTALGALGIGPGDEVIVPPLTMMSPTFAVLHAGATPVFADVDPKTWTLDPIDVTKKISKKTKAVIPVSLYGCPPDMDKILAIAKKQRIAVIEDNAQCVLGTYKRKTVGTMSDFASFSFQNSKHLSAGEGGILLTNNEELARKARRFSFLGFASLEAGSKGKTSRSTIQDPRYERHLSLGWNYRIAEPAAAIALAQTERMSELVQRRREVAALFAKVHQGCSWLLPQSQPANSEHAYWTYALKLHGKRAPTWYEFRDKYLSLGGDWIYSAWQLSYLEPVLRGKKMGSQVYKKGLCPVAESLQPGLLQFKTNYLDLAIAEQKATALKNTIQAFSV